MINIIKTIGRNFLYSVISILIADTIVNTILHFLRTLQQKHIDESLIGVLMFMALVDCYIAMIFTVLLSIFSFIFRIKLDIKENKILVAIAILAPCLISILYFLEYRWELILEVSAMNELINFSWLYVLLLMIYSTALITRKKKEKR